MTKKAPVNQNPAQASRNFENHSSPVKYDLEPSDSVIDLSKAAEEAAKALPVNNQEAPSELRVT